MTADLANSATHMRAYDPETPSAELQRLSRHRDRSIRTAVAANPNTSTPVLDVLGRKFPEAIAANPVLDWLLLEDANWLAGFHEVSRHRLLMEPTVDTGLLWWAARFGSADDKLAVAQNPNCSVELLTYLSDIGLPTVTDSVGAHINSSAIAHAAGAAASFRIAVEPLSNHSGNIAALLGFGVIPPALYPSLIQGDVLIRRAVALAVDTPPSVLAVLLVDDDPETRALARAHHSIPNAVVTALNGLTGVEPDADLSLLARLSDSNYLELLLARHPGTDPEQLNAMVSSGNWKVREAVAANPALSVESIVLLAADLDKDVRVALMANVTVPAFVIDWLVRDWVEEVARAAQTAKEALRGRPVAEPEHDGVDTAADFGRQLLLGLLPGNRTVGVLLGRDPELPITLLRELGADGDWRIRQSCAANLATPTDVLDQLIRDSDSDVRNAALSNPNATNEMVRKIADPVHAEVRARIVRDSNDPADFDAFVADSAVVVREAVAAHALTPADMLHVFATDTDTSVRQLVAARDALPHDIVVKLAADTDENVQQRIMQRGEPPDDVLIGLFHDRRRGAINMRAGQFRRLLAGGNEIGRSEIMLLRKAPMWMRIHAVRTTNNTRLLRAMAESDDWYTRAAVATHPRTSGAVLRKLADDTDYDVRTAVASRPQLPERTMFALARDTHVQVRTAILARSDLSGRAVEAMAYDDDDDIRNRVSAHPLLSEESRRRFRSLGEHRPLSESELKLLAGASPQSRRLVAQHPATPPRILAALSRDENWHVREDVAAHPKATPAILRRLSGEGDRDIRRAVAGNKQVPQSVLETLVADGDESVRLAAGRNPRLPHALRQRIIADSMRLLTRSDAVVDRLVLLSSRACPEHELRRRRNWQSTRWEIRATVAGHPTTPAAVLARLTNDANRTVREIAISQRSTADPETCVVSA